MATSETETPRYRTEKSFYIDGRLFKADARNPKTFNFDPEGAPNPRWVPLNDAAVEQVHALCKQKGIPEERWPQKPEDESTPKVVGVKKKDNDAPKTVSEVHDEQAQPRRKKRGAKRAADTTPV